MSIFGDILTGDDVEKAVVAHLKNWSRTYLAELERQTDRTADSLPQVRSFTTTPREPEKWPEDQLPAILVVSPGLADVPNLQGDGQMRATWSVGIAAIVEARSEAATRTGAHLYFAHAMAIMLQKAGIGGIADDTMLATPWQYDVLPVESRRTLGAVYAVFEVSVDEVLNTRGGPEEPLAEPYEDPGDWPTAETVEVTADKP